MYGRLSKILCPLGSSKGLAVKRWDLLGIDFLQGPLYYSCRAFARLASSFPMDREERAVLAAWERVQDAERKRCAQQNRRMQRASRKQQVHHSSVPSTHLANLIA